MGPGSTPWPGAQRPGTNEREMVHCLQLSQREVVMGAFPSEATDVSSVREHQLDALLHRGATSEIWRATRLGPNGFVVPVVLKTLNDACRIVPEQVRGFLKEARAASTVQHHNVVQVRELIFDHNRYWLCMELVTGWSVRALLSLIAGSGESIPVPVALALARDTARGLQAIHEAGLVHRNIAPENLLIASTGRLVVLDFGLAIWQHVQRVRFTPPVEVVDPVYASPELRARLPVDARTDVYGLGALLDQLIPERASAPIALDAIIQRALDPDPERRFPSAQALGTALDLVSIREGWLMPPSYVSAYVSDVFRSTEPAKLSSIIDSLSEDAEVSTPQIEDRHAPVGRAILPRGRRGMIGVGAVLPGPHAKNDPAAREPAHDSAQPPARWFSSRSRTLGITRVRVRR
jgi:serine/threonine protein kinase